jgi:serine/threonine protein kinase
MAVQGETQFPMPLRPADPLRLGEWTLIEVLGEGGFGVVYKGSRQIQSGQILAAIKVVKIPKKADKSEIDARLRGFAQEFKILKQLESQYIAKVYEFGVEPYPWMATELVKGDNLAEEIEQHGTLDENEWFRLAFDLLSALDTAGSKGVVHRDVKPANIMRFSKRSILVDFGIASIETPAGDQEGGMLSFIYAAPEQYLGKKVTPKSDVFSAGVSLIQAATGRRPWSSERKTRDAWQKDIVERVLYTKPDVSGLTPRQLAMVTKMLPVNPDERISTAQALRIATSNLPANDSRRKTISIPSPKKDRVENSDALQKYMKSVEVVPNEKSKWKSFVFAALLNVVGLVPYFHWQQRRASQQNLSKRRLAALGILAFSWGQLGWLTSALWYQSGKSSLAAKLTIVQSALFLCFCVWAVPNGEPSFFDVFFFTGPQYLFFFSNLALSIFAIIKLPASNEKVEVAPTAEPKKKKDAVEIKSETKFVKDATVVQSRTKTKRKEPIDANETVLTIRDRASTNANYSQIRQDFERQLTLAKPKKFVFDVLTSAGGPYYVQGMQDEFGYFTVEAVSDNYLSTKLSTEQKRSLIQLGWEPPSQDLPNYIQFLDKLESNYGNLARLFSETFEKGYGISATDIQKVDLKILES